MIFKQEDKADIKELLDECHVKKYHFMQKGNKTILFFEGDRNMIEEYNTIVAYMVGYISSIECNPFNIYFVYITKDIISQDLESKHYAKCLLTNKEANYEKLASDLILFDNLKFEKKGKGKLTNAYIPTGISSNFYSSFKEFRKHIEKNGEKNLTLISPTVLMSKEDESTTIDYIISLVDNYGFNINVTFNREYPSYLLKKKREEIC